MRSISHAEFHALRRFPALDGLRAVAALMVFAYHFGGARWGWLSGWIGVHLFFVLSGFLITTLLLREEDRYRRISFRAFYIRRFFRIMPVYLVVVAAAWSLAYLRGSDELVRKALPYCLLLLNEFGAKGPLIHTWTIGIEQKFYLFWPAIAFLLAAGAFRRRLGVTIALIVFLIALIPLDVSWLSWPIHYVAILVGCLTAIVMHHPRGYGIVRPLTHPVVATAVVVGFVGAHLAVRHWPGAWGQEGLIGIYAVAAAVLLPALLSRSVPARLLALRPLVFIGERSYSMYLVQMIASTTVSGLIPNRAHSGTLYLAGSVLVGLAAADLLYRWVELPMIEVGRRLAARQRGPEHGGEPPARTVPGFDGAEDRIPAVVR